MSSDIPYSCYDSKIIKRFDNKIREAYVTLEDLK